MSEIDDRELKRLFSELARAEERSAPPFRRPAENARQPRRVRRPLVFAAVAAVVVIAAAASLQWSNRQAAQPAGRAASTVTIASWSAPTDFLLETPGDEILSSTSYDAVSYESLASATKSANEGRKP